MEIHGAARRGEPDRYKFFETFENCDDETEW